MNIISTYRQFEFFTNVEGNMKEVLIVEDNESAVDAVKNILNEIDEDAEVYVASDCESARTLSIEHTIDLFVVDVVLNQKNPNDASGLDFIQFIRGFKRYEYSPVVITTSIGELKEYAYDVLDCYKYLEKPYNHEKAFRVLSKALRMPLHYQEEQYLHIRNDGLVKAIKYSEIACILYEDRKVTIETAKGVVQIYYKSLSDIQAQLQGHNFIRCNKNAIINKDYVESVDMKNNMVIMKFPFAPVKISIAQKKKILGELIK